jgi:hypothetical protein
MELFDPPAETKVFYPACQKIVKLKEKFESGLFVLLPITYDPGSRHQGQLASSYAHHAIVIVL